jgi:hypothetical protein
MTAETSSEQMDFPTSLQYFMDCILHSFLCCCSLCEVDAPVSEFLCKRFPLDSYRYIFSIHKVAFRQSHGCSSLQVERAHGATDTFMCDFASP